MGVVSPIGNDVATFTANLKAGKHGFVLNEWFKEHAEEGTPPTRVSALVKNFTHELIEPYFEKKELRRTDIISQYAVYTAMKALQDCGTNFADIDPYKCGVYVASGIGGIETSHEQIMTYHNRGVKRVSVFTIPMMIGNMAPGLVAIKASQLIQKDNGELQLIGSAYSTQDSKAPKAGFKGNNYCPVSACSSSAHAIGEAFRAIKHGYLDAAIAGGTECCHLGFSYAAFGNMTALTFSSDPDRASIPFDKERSGFVLGDGAANLILEEYEHAKARGARIYGEVAGYGATCDAYHETSPNPDGSGGAKAMELALQEAGLKPSDVDYINAHGTSTPINDPTETLAIKSALGEHAYKIAVNSTKSMTGHLLGAAGGVESVAVLQQMNGGFIHPTVGYKVPDPECDLDYVTDGVRTADVRVALSNSLGFGGHNVTLCFTKV
ncbi:MAG: beta-ketoacyl-[acyl-carrier-protein] synthase II [Oscillospiraceae bacterium]|nr:beta-ketoacyl-[acyl-carrier-protein] synthase II [Oscillospiraceae bacterium]